MYQTHPNCCGIWSSCLTYFFFKFLRSSKVLLYTRSAIHVFAIFNWIFFSCMLLWMIYYFARCRGAFSRMDSYGRQTRFINIDRGEVCNMPYKLMLEFYFEFWIHEHYTRMLVIFLLSLSSYDLMNMLKCNRCWWHYFVFSTVCIIGKCWVKKLLVCLVGRDWTASRKKNKLVLIHYDVWFFPILCTEYAFSTLRF